MAGRPSKFKAEYIEQARKLCAKGFTDFELSQFFGIHRSTLYVWQSESDEFANAMQAGKEIADNRVERSLFEKAVGYSFPAERIFSDKGTIVRAEYIEHVPPSDVAGMFWLKNRKKDQWRDKQEFEHTGKDGEPIKFNYVVPQNIPAPSKEDYET